MGVECGEQEKRAGADAGVTSFGFLHNFPDPSRTLLQVRNPLDCIASLHTTNTPLDISFTGIEPRSKLHRCMLWYYHANRKIAETADVIYRVQHAPEVLSREFELPYDMVEALFLQHKDSNSRKNRPTYRSVSWAEMQFEDARLSNLIFHFWSYLQFVQAK